MSGLGWSDANEPGNRWYQPLTAHTPTPAPAPQGPGAFGGMRTLITLALLALTGCNVYGPELLPEHEPHGEQPSAALERAQVVTIDPSATPAELDAIARAVEAWNAVLTCTQLSPVIAPVTEGDRFGVRMVDGAELADCTGLPAGEELAPGLFVMGCADARGIRLMRGGPLLYQSAAHELGHMLGLAHDDVPGRLMSAVGAHDEGPSAADGAAVCALGVW